MPKKHLQETKQEKRLPETPGRNSCYNFVACLSQSPMRGKVEDKGRNSGLRNYRNNLLELYLHACMQYKRIIY